jgi:hypothetical protein
MPKMGAPPKTWEKYPKHTKKMRKNWKHMKNLEETLGILLIQFMWLTKAVSFTRMTSPPTGFYTNNDILGVPHPPDWGIHLPCPHSLIASGVSLPIAKPFVGIDGVRELFQKVPSFCICYHIKALLAWTSLVQ